VLNNRASAPPVLRSTAWRAALAIAILAATASGVCAGPIGGAAIPLDQPAFRLGTAAAPFSAAKRVGDFDLDGRTDLAVVDRLTTRGGETRYLLEVDLSNGTTQNLVFSSAQPALDITLVDIDHDGDVDIVLTPILTRAIAAIWVNDGSGRFVEATGPDSPPALPPSCAGQPPASEFETVPAATAPSRAICAAGIAAQTAAPPPDGARALPASPANLRFACPLSFGSRAPPSSLR